MGNVTKLKPETINKSGIHPTEYKALVKPKTTEGKIGSILIPDEHKDREQFAQMEGELIAASPLAFTYEDWKEHDDQRPRPGDRVLFAKFAGTKITGADGVEYRLINDKDIGAVLR